MKAFGELINCTPTPENMHIQIIFGSSELNAMISNA